MKRHVVGPTMIVLLCMAGCMGPIRSNPDRSASSNHASSEARHNARAERSAPQSPGDRVTVNSEIINASELLRFIREDVSRQAATLSPVEFRAHVKQQSPRWIHDKITEMLLYQKASLQYTEEVQANIDKFVDAEVRKIVTTEHEGIERRYDKHLESLGLTIDDIRQQLRREVIITSFLQQEIRPKIVEPTRADLLAAYKENVQKWSKPPRKAMSLIDVRVRDRLGESAANPSQEQLDSARAEARSIIESAQQELRSGTEFSEVAKRYSDGLHKLEGGSWGWVSAGSVRARFEPAVGALYQLEENGFSDIIESQDAFFIVKCDQFDPGHTPTFQQAQPVLREEYNRIAYNQLIAELVTELRNKAHIEPRNLEPFHNAVVAEALALQTAGPQ